MSKIDKKSSGPPPFKRLHLFEFGDLNIPQIFHDLLTDFLGHFSKMGIYDSVVPLLKQVIENQDCTTIIDLCSGSGEPVIHLKQKMLRDYSIDLDVVLTDKFPNLSKAKEFDHKKDITYFTESIDATLLPEKLTRVKSLRTLFTSLHHFKPKQVQAILQDAVNHNQPIAAMEFTERTWLRIFCMLPGTLHMLLITPFIKPFSFKRIFWTYCIPIMPLVFLWDGLISNLRTYTPEELESIIYRLDNNHFSWKVETISTGRWPFNITYLIGKPESSEP